MLTASAAPLLSVLLMMLLVVTTGTAWFTALHPRFVWRVLQGGCSAEESDSASFQALRAGGVLFGAAGLLLLFLLDLVP